MKAYPAKWMWGVELNSVQVLGDLCAVSVCTEHFDFMHSNAESGSWGSGAVYYHAVFSELCTEELSL